MRDIHAPASPPPEPARYRRESDYERFVPVHVVWELTLACDLKCLHCGSRAGKRRPDELSTAECLDVVDRLAKLGTREVSLIGGEAYLRKDWTTIIRAIRDRGMNCATQTGGRGLNAKRLAAAVDAGLQGVGVSLDGMATLHDKLRAVSGSFRAATDTLLRAKASGLKTSVNTQIGAEVMPQLPALMDHIISTGATHWQIQLTVAMGNAVDNPELLLQPYQLAELMPLLARLFDEGADRGLLMIPGNNIGYFGPYEHLWRGQGDDSVHWTGCTAGHTALALEADGTVKGCPSLATNGFAGGNVRDIPLEEIWRSSPEIHFGRMRSAEDSWGFCRTCYYAEVCRGGCTWTAHSLLGRPGNNPYCHHRVIELAKHGLRERIAKVRDAPNASFAIGEFELITESVDAGGTAAAMASTQSRPNLVQISAPTQRPAAADMADRGRVPPKLAICRGCHEYIWPGEPVCPHCAADVEAKEAEHQVDAARRAAVMNEVRRLLAEAGSHGP